MLTKLKYNEFFKIIGLLSICCICIYGFSNSKHSIQNIAQIASSYISIGLQFSIFLWACFTPKIKDRIGVAFYCGGIFLAFVAFQLGLETIKSLTSQFVFDNLTTLSVILLYRRNES